MILYYSNKCKHCHRMLSEYDPSIFTLVCVDNSEYPEYVLSVPTIVEEDKMYVGSMAFKFVKESQDFTPYEYESDSKNMAFSFTDDRDCTYTESTNFSEIGGQNENPVDFGRSANNMSLENIINQRDNELKKI